MNTPEFQNIVSGIDIIYLFTHPRSWDDYVNQCKLKTEKLLSRLAKAGPVRMITRYVQSQPEQIVLQDENEEVHVWETVTSWRGLVVLIPIPESMSLIVGASWVHNSDWRRGKKNYHVGLWRALSNGVCISMNTMVALSQVQKFPLSTPRSCAAEVQKALDIFRTNEYPGYLEARISELQNERVEQMAKELQSKNLIAGPEKKKGVKKETKNTAKLCGKKCSGGKKK